MDSERNRGQTKPGGSPGPPRRVAETFAELGVPGLQAILREELPRRQHGVRARPTAQELEILAALWSYGFMFANQIWRRWWPQRTERWAYQALKRMTQAGWLHRYKPVLANGGTQQRFYSLAEHGFELARGRRFSGRDEIRRDASWRELVIDRASGQLPRELHVNGWVLALEQIAGPLMSGWHGPLQSQLIPPRRRTREGWVPMRPADIELGTSHRLVGCQAHVLEPVSPHATIELQVDDNPRTELMVEYDQGEDLYETEERLQRYDLFLSGWAHLLERYRPPARPPIVVFVCGDDKTLACLLEIADRALTTRVAKAGTTEHDWPFPGRRSILFARERDIHQRSLHALAVPARSSDLRSGPLNEGGPPEGVRKIEIIHTES